MGFVFLLLSWGGSQALADGLADIEGIWRLPSEFPGRTIYYFEIKNGQSHLSYPPEADFVGQVPHAANAFKAGGPDEFILSPTLQTPDGPVNLFANLARQTGLKGFEALAKSGLTYKKNEAGELIPQVPDELKTWLPKMVRTTRPELTAARLSGENFKRSLYRQLQISFPQDNAIVTCPQGLTQLLSYPTGAFEALKKISKFTPIPGADAKIDRGESSKLTLFVQDSPNERAVAFYFFEGEAEKFSPLKMYLNRDNEWVIPNGNKDPVTGAPLCQRVLMQPAIPVVTGGRGGRGGGVTGGAKPE